MFDNKVNYNNICKFLWYLPQISLKFEPNLFDICVKSLSYLRRISFIFAPNLFYICTKYLSYLFATNSCDISHKSFLKLRQICLIFASNLYHICTKSLFIFATNPFDICELFSIAKQRRWRQKWADCISSATQPILEATIRGKEI